MIKQDGYCFRRLNILLSLLEHDVRKGPLCEIVKQSGYSTDDGLFYTVKGWLLNEKILLPEGTTRIRIGNGEKEVPNYRVDQKAIWIILCAEWKTKVLYEGFLNNKVDIFPRLKPRKKEL